MLKKLLILVFLLIAFFSNAQYKLLEKAKKNIYKKNWEDTEKYLTKYTAESGGLSFEYIYINALYLYHRGEGIEKLEESLSKLQDVQTMIGNTKKENGNYDFLKNACEDIQLCPDSLQRIYNRIDSLIFVYYTKDKNLDLINSFLDKNKINSRYPMAIYLRDSLNYEVVLKIATVKSLEAYIINYPNSKFIAASKKKIIDVDLSEAIKENSIESFEKFRSQHPKSEYEKTIKRNLAELYWRKIEKNQTINNLTSFCENFPESEYYQDAYSMLEKISWDEIIQNPFDINLKKFLNAFPNGKFKEDATTLLKKIEIKVLPFLNAQKKYVLIDIATNQQINNNEFDEVDYIETGAFLVTKDGNKGIISRDGNILIPINYSCLGTIDAKYYEAAIENLHGLFDLNGKEVFPLKYASFSVLKSYNKNLNPKENSSLILVGDYNSKDEVKYGIFNMNGNVIIPIQYENINYLTQNRFVVTQSGKKFLVDDTGKKLTSAFENLYEFSTESNLLLASNNSKYSLLSINGVEFVPAIYQSIQSGALDEAIVTKDGKSYGIIKTNGQIIKAPVLCRDIVYFSEHLYGIQSLKESEFFPKYTLYDSEKKIDLWPGELFKVVSKIDSSFFIIESTDRIKIFDLNWNFKKQFLKNKADDENESDIAMGDGGEGAGDYMDSGTCNLYTITMSDTKSNSYNYYEKSLPSIYINDKTIFFDKNLDELFGGNYTSIYNAGSLFYNVSTNEAKSRDLIIKKNGEIFLQNARYIGELTYNPIGEKRVYIRFSEDDIDAILDLNSNKINRLDKNISLYKDFGSFRSYTFKGVGVFETGTGKRLIAKDYDFRPYEAEKSISGIWSFFNEKKIDECIRLSQTALNIYPAYANANYWLARCYFEKENYNLSLEYINKAINQTINISFDETYINQKIEINKKLNKNLEVANDYLLITERNNVDNYDADYYFNAGYYFSAANEIQNSISAYKKCLAINPNNPDAYNNLGVCYQKSGNNTQALEYYKKAIENPGLNSNEDKALYYQNCAKILFDMNNWDEACLYYKKAVDLNPKIIEKYNPGCN